MKLVGEASIVYVQGQDQRRQPIQQAVITGTNHKCEVNMKQLPAEFCTRMKALLSEEEYDAFLESFEKPTVRGLRLNLHKLMELEESPLREARRGLASRADAGEQQDLLPRTDDVYVLLPR